MNRIKCFEEALDNCQFAFKKNPTVFPLESIISQLKYLIDLEKGISRDFSKLPQIKIGWIAVRELDGYEDEKLIQSLCIIDAEVEKMKIDYKV